MKLGAAIRERNDLKYRLDILGSRLANDSPSSISREQISEEIVLTANKLRDLNVAISWTEHGSLVAELPLTAYRVRAATNRLLAELHEGIDNDSADKFYRLAVEDEKMAEKAAWLIELQVPVFSSDEEPEEKI